MEESLLLTYKMLPGEALNQDISDSEILHVVSKQPTVDLLKLLDVG